MRDRANIDINATILDAIEWFNREYPERKVTGAWIEARAKEKGQKLAQAQYSRFKNGCDLYLSNASVLLSILPDEAFLQVLERLRMQRYPKEPVSLREWLYTRFPPEWKLPRQLQKSGVRRGGLPRASMAQFNSLASLIESGDPTLMVQALSILEATGRPTQHQRLLDTLKSVTSDRAEDLKWQAAFALGTIRPEDPQAGIRRGKLIRLGTQEFVLLVGVVPLDCSHRASGTLGVALTLQSPDPFYALPTDVHLLVLDEEGRAKLQGTSNGREKSMTFRFSPPNNSEFIVRLRLGEGASETERFRI
ncbi:MAG: DUF1822 family protein [Cyanobacteriota bacterium]|nr:DUF1822 family protein [Cyanobacteriota bacterium]